jgi:hypothetical protein
MTIRIYVCLIVTLSMAIAQSVRASQSDSLSCTSSICCGSNDPTPAGVMLSHIHPKREWMFSYKWMSMNMSGVMSGSQSISNEAVFTNYLMSPKNMSMNMHMLMGMYGITNRLSAMVMVNYSSLTMQMEMFVPGGHHHAGSTDAAPSHTMESAGLSDTKAYLLYGLLHKPNHQVFVSGGMSFPTGSILVTGNADNMMYPNTRLPYSMQLGSGTFDVLPCINYLYQRGKFTASSQLSAVVRTGYNPVGYRLGNEFLSNSWLAYQWSSFISSSIRLEASAQKAISGTDPSLYRFNEPAANTQNYGGKKMIGYIGSVLHINKGVFKNAGIAAEYGIPVYQYYNGIQMRQQQSWSVSLLYGF